MAEYTGMNFREVQNLYIDEFRLLFRDAFIYKLQQNEQGRNYLEECWILEQTEPDRETLKKFGKG